MKISRYSRNDGFSLVEVLVVMVILALVVTAALSLVIPAKRSTVVQSDLASVQMQMRLSMERIAKDLRNGGFLVRDVDTDGDGVGDGDDNPLFYDPATSDTGDISGIFTATKDNPLVIRTQAVSGIFGRIDTENLPAVETDPFTFIFDDHYRFFAENDYVAIAEPLNGNFLGNQAEDSNIYQVDSVSAAGVVLKNFSAADLGELADSPAGLVMLLMRADTRTPLNQKASFTRRIKYWAEDGILKRLIDYDDGAVTAADMPYARGLSQRGITSLQYQVSVDDEGAAEIVDVTVVGQPVKASAATADDAFQRSITYRVSLRNI